VENTPGYDGTPRIVDCGDFTNAVKTAAAEAQAGDVVLMSPASAAFDQFKNFEYRGRYYKALVKEL
jgi:UDP-N-acetylmuramoylalanine--D-glutamate ligase